MNAGWQGLFAIEKNSDAFATLSSNLMERKGFGFSWPDWLPKKALAIEEFLEVSKNKLQPLRGNIGLLAGGPPCQGFSTFGKRNEGDPRNLMFLHYLQVVEKLSPKMILMENVRGILAPFSKPVKNGSSTLGRGVAYADIIRSALENKYRVWTSIVHAKDYGVPQNRPRFILIGVRKDIALETQIDPFVLLTRIRESFLTGKGLSLHLTSAKEALSDLRRKKELTYDSQDSIGYKNGGYGEQSSSYQKLMHRGVNDRLADSHRFTKHLPATVEKFRWLLDNCVSGKKLAQSERGSFCNNKHVLSILNPDRVAPTVTTLPDDIIHYAEPRILTVREMARLQSFPDWFQFKGKYTTGGPMRTKECPRYTQVGNAVPPLLAEALGAVLLKLLRNLLRD